MMREFARVAPSVLALASLTAVLGAAGIAACSSDSNSTQNTTADGGSDAGSGGGADTGEAGCVAYTPPSGTDLKTPVVSFKTDVAPIFQASCGNFSSCHQSAGTGNNGLHLEGEASAMRAGIVGKKSDKIDMNFITAGDLPNSYIMHKMDGDQCTLNAKCKGGDCEGSMPDRNPILETARRDVVRRWIAQGALDN